MSRAVPWRLGGRLLALGHGCGTAQHGLLRAHMRGCQERWHVSLHGRVTLKLGTCLAAAPSPDRLRQHPKEVAWLQ